MRGVRSRFARCSLILVVITLIAARAFAQAAPPPSCPGGVCIVTTQAQLAEALNQGGTLQAASGDIVRFGANITQKG